MTTDPDGGNVSRMVTRTETREERDARLIRESDAADAGAYDHVFARGRDYLISQLPDGYAFEGGRIVRTDPTLPDHFWIPAISNGVPTGRMAKITAL